MDVDCDFCVALGVCQILFAFGVRCFFKPTTALAACILIMFDVVGMDAVLLQHNGDILFSVADRGCSRSGDRARRNNGEFVSALLGRPNDVFFVPPIAENAPETHECDVHDELLHEPTLLHAIDDVELLGKTQPGLYDCVVFDEPS